MTKPLTISISVELDEEQIRDLFDEYEIRFSKKKVKELSKELDELYPDAQEEIEETFREFLGNMIQDLFD